MMKPRAPTNLRPLVPDLPSVKTALAKSEPLAGLMQRLRASQQCLQAIQPVLPLALAAYVQAGPLDEDGWTLLVANNAISAKLRQLLPRMDEALSAQGLKVTAIRIRVQSPP